MAWSATELEAVRRHLPINPLNRWAQRPFPASPKGLTPAGLQDYRAFPLEHLTHFDISDADFSGARSPKNELGVAVGIGLDSCRCRNLRFDRGGRFYSLHGVYDSCSFERITTERCGFNGLYRNCTFQRANLQRARLGGEFVDCRFEAANLEVDSWGGVSFQRCRFIQCKVSPLFADIREALGSGGPVTFAVLVSGTLKIGEAVKFFNPRGLLSQ